MHVGVKHMKSLKRFFSNKITIMISLMAIMLISVFFAVLIGSVRLSFKEVFSVLFGGNKDSAEYRIIMYVRLPRVIGAVVAGSALAVAGAILQSILNNSLASPGIIGVNAGSGLFALIAMIIFPSSLIAMPLGAFIGAFVATITVWLVALRTGASKSTIILAGVAISSLFTAILDTIVTVNPDLQMDRLAFSIGGFSGVDYKSILYVLPFYVIGLIGALFISYDMNVLMLGDEIAGSLGMRTKIVRLIAILLVALLAGSAVSIAGLLGFVGLIVPHAIGRIVGKDMRFLIPCSAFFGAALTIICDIIARTAFSPYEIPVGIILSFVGVPFFLILLFKRKRRRVC